MHLIETQLFGITAADPANWIAVISLLLLMTALATRLPARRAARIDPLIALRSE